MKSVETLTAMDASPALDIHDKVHGTAHISWRRIVPGVEKGWEKRRLRPGGRLLVHRRRGMTQARRKKEPDYR